VQQQVLDLLRAVWSRQDADVVSKYAGLAEQWRQHLLEDPSRVHQPLPFSQELQSILTGSTLEHASDIFLLACREAGVTNPDPVVFQTLEHYYRDYMPMIAGDLDGSMSGTVQKAVSSGLQAGMGEKDIALGVLQNVLPLGAARLRTIARTELTNAATMSRVGIFSQAGIQLFEYSPILDDSTTKTCRNLNGYILDVQDPLARELLPSNHFRCFEPDVLILTSKGNVRIADIKVGDFVLTHRMRWRKVTSLHSNPSPDRLIEITQSNGRKTRATGNHPALTQRGWIEFSSLKPGDKIMNAVMMFKSDVVCDSGRQISCLNKVSHPEKRNANRSFSDFNQKIEVGNIEIGKMQSAIDLNGMLPDNFIASLLKNVGNDHFTGSHLRLALPVHHRIIFNAYTSALFGTRFYLRGVHPLPFFKFLGSSGYPWMRLLCQSNSKMWATIYNLFHQFCRILPTHASINPLSPYSLSSMSNRNIVFLEKKRNDLSMFISVSQSSSNAPSGHHFNGIHFGQHITQAFSVFFFKFFPGFLPHTHIIDVEPSEVMRVEIVNTTSERVHNFSVQDDESYVAGGVIVHNCRALVVPAEDDAKATHHDQLQRALKIRALEFPGWGQSRIAPYIGKMLGGHHG
jgi:SPP1 gp7 family putative phage head morphogenesis protein